MKGYLKNKEEYMANYKELTTKCAENDKMKSDLLRTFSGYLKKYTSENYTCLNTLMVLCGLRNVEIRNSRWSIEEEILFHTVLSENKKLLEIFQDLVSTEGHPKLQTKVVVSDYEKLLSACDKN